MAEEAIQRGKNISWGEWVENQIRTDDVSPKMRMKKYYGIFRNGLQQS